MAPSGAPRGLANERGSIGIATQSEGNNQQLPRKFPRRLQCFQNRDDSVVKTF